MSRPRALSSGFCDKNSDCPIYLLSLDGGGVRGLASLEYLSRLEAHMCKHDGCLADIFDVIIGTSIGGILALCLGVLRMRVEQIRNFFIKQDGLKNILGCASFLDDAIGLAQPWPKYDGAEKTHALRCLFSQETSVFTPRLCDVSPTGPVVVVTGFDMQTRKLQVFSSAHSTLVTSPLDALADAISAAPAYFPTGKPVTLETPTHERYTIPTMDAGVDVNNPTLLGCAHILELLRERGARFANFERIRALSVGTGYYPEPLCGLENAGGLQWMISRGILHAAMDQQAIEWTAQSLFSPSNYLRVDSKLSRDIELDDTTEDTITYLKSIGECWWSTYKTQSEDLLK